MSSFDYHWKKDTGFSKNLMSKVKDIIEKEITLPKNIRNNFGTSEDIDKGHDLSIETKLINVGVRNRRYPYKTYDQFSEDDKELGTVKNDIYFFGYSTPDEKELSSCIVFNHHDFRAARDEGQFNVERVRNRKHSIVWANYYLISDIMRTCEVYYKMGNIGWRSSLDMFSSLEDLDGNY